MNSLQELGSWGSNLLGQAQTHLAPAATVAGGYACNSFQRGADLFNKGKKAVKEVVKENFQAPCTPFVGASHTIEDPREGVIRSVTEVGFLAEGAFGSVVKVTEVRTGKEYALKKIQCQENVQVASSLAAAEREARILTTLPQHPNIILCLGYAIDKRAIGETVKLLMELCRGGHLLDFMDRKNGKLSAREVLEPFTQITEAVRHLHAQRPPIQHRDLKVENVLQGADGNWKLCDFGSCSTECVPAEELPRSRLLELQEEIDKTVTMLYRPPEMADIELNYRKGYTISEQVDVWMLGCILYTLAFYRHPFQDNATAMAISNAKYFIPSDHELARSAKLCGLIHWLMAADPKDRPSTAKLRDVLRDIGKCKYEEMLASMPAAVREKIRKLDIYAARRDTGDIPLPDNLGAAVAAAQAVAAQGSRGTGASRDSPQRGGAGGQGPSPAASPPADIGSFDLQFALSTADAAPTRAAEASAPAPERSARSAQAPAGGDLLGFNTPPATVATAAAGAPPLGALGNLLDFDEPARLAPEAQAGSAWASDLFSVQDTHHLAAPTSASVGSMPVGTSPARGSPMSSPMGSSPNGLGAAFPSAVSSPVGPGAASPDLAFAGSSCWQSAAPAPAVATDACGAFGLDCFADFSAAPPPPVAASDGWSAGTRTAAPAAAPANLLDF